MGIEAEAKPRQETAQTSQTKPDPQSTLRHDAQPNAAATQAETLRAKLDAAILAEEWDAVKIIGARLREVERQEATNVIDLRVKR
jgi:hypothetical protein